MRDRQRLDSTLSNRLAVAGRELRKKQLELLEFSGLPDDFSEEEQRTGMRDRKVDRD